MGWRRVGTAQLLLRVRDGDARGGAGQRMTSRPRCHAPGAATSRSRLPASPSPLACAQRLARFGLPIVPPKGGIFISGIPRRLTAPRGSALLTSLPAPLGRGARNQYLRRRHCHRRHLSLLRPYGHSHVARRLARHCRARRCPQRPR
jgi:hypothetical protein